MSSKENNHRRELMVHILCWGIVLFMPLLFWRANDTWAIRVGHWARSAGGTLSYMLVFYVNYLWLIPRYWFGRRRHWFFVINFVVILAAIGFSFGWWSTMGSLLPDDFRAPRGPHKFKGMFKPGGGPHPPIVSMIFQAVLMMALVVALALAIAMGQRWQRLEEERREAEKARAEAELTNLRNQLNPHFLLNTLNNIYALIAFNPDKAQEAVGDLSKLLRHVLYENQQNYVPLYKEVAFMNNYIELMRIRVTQNVTIDKQLDVAGDDSTPIAPLIFISLIENAFKHGISQGGGHISIALRQQGGDITCEIRNSNHPKRANDKSGSGIGLQQVQKRLDLMYPGHYSWQKGLTDDKTEYYSIITIHTDDSEMRHS